MMHVGRNLICLAGDELLTKHMFPQLNNINSVKYINITILPESPIVIFEDDDSQNNPITIVNGTSIPFAYSIVVGVDCKLYIEYFIE